MRAGRSRWRTEKARLENWKNKVKELEELGKRAEKARLESCKSYRLESWKI